MTATTECNICGIELTERNSCCCWESECQHMKDMGTYCGNCYPSHVESMHT